MFSVPLFMFIFTKADCCHGFILVDCEMLWLLAEKREEERKRARPGSPRPLIILPSSSDILTLHEATTQSDLARLPLNLMMLLGSYFVAFIKGTQFEDKR